MLQPGTRGVEYKWQCGFETRPRGLSKLNARGDKLIWITDCLQHPLPSRRIILATQYRVADLAQQFEVGIGPGDATIWVQIAWPLDEAPLVAISSRRNMRLQVMQTLFADWLFAVE